MSVVIGLTGGIASGKSTVSAMFREMDIPVVDADIIAREIVQPGEEAYTQIIAAFGEEIMLEDGMIDRKALGSMVFADENKRRRLNDIVHPAVRERMIRDRDAYVDAGYECVVLDIPLLFESELTHFCDRTLVVYVSESVQKERLMARDDYSGEEAEKRIRSQMPIEDKKARADAIIDNNDTIRSSQQQLQFVLEKWGVRAAY